MYSYLPISYSLVLSPSSSLISLCSFVAPLQILIPSTNQLKTVSLETASQVFSFWFNNFTQESDSIPLFQHLKMQM